MCADYDLILISQFSSFVFRAPVERSLIVKSSVKYVLAIFLLGFLYTSRNMEICIYINIYIKLNKQINK